MARRMLCITVSRKSLAEIETRRALGNGIQEQRGHDGTDELSDGVRNYLSSRKTAPRGQSYGHGRAEVASRNVPDCIRHGSDSETESERDAEKADTDLGKAGGDHRASTSPERQPEGTDRLGN